MANENDKANQNAPAKVRVRVIHVWIGLDKKLLGKEIDLPAADAEYRIKCLHAERVS